MKDPDRYVKARFNDSFLQGTQVKIPEKYMIHMIWFKFSVFHRGKFMVIKAILVLFYYFLKIIFNKLTKLIVVLQ